ncbi:replication initiator protein [Escherichia coli]|nr:replication initiator protein [Escherichia coli]
MGSCAAPSAKGDDKFITTDYLQQCPKISCQLKLIRFTGESAIAFSLLSGQKVNGHIGLPA